MACAACRRSSERSSVYLKRSSTATSAASRSISAYPRPRPSSTRSRPEPTSSSTASVRRPRAGWASTPRRCARGIRVSSARRSAGSARTGPYVERAAHDINYQALAGLWPLANEPPRSARSARRRHRRGDDRRDRHSRGALPAETGPASARTWTCRSTKPPWPGRCFPRPPTFPPFSYHLYETADGQWLGFGAPGKKSGEGFGGGLGSPDRVRGERGEGAARARPAEGSGSRTLRTPTSA